MPVQIVWLFSKADCETDLLTLFFDYFSSSSVPAPVHPLVMEMFFGYAGKADLIIEALEENTVFHTA